MTTEIWPGDRVVLFDNLLFENDIDTPLSVTMQPATVIRRYGYKSQVCGIYPDLIDVCFDHDGRESNGHFTSGAKATSTATQERQKGNGRAPPDRDGWLMFDEHGTGGQKILVIDGHVADDTDWEQEVGHAADLNGMSWNYWEGNPVEDMTDGTLTSGVWKWIGPAKKPEAAR